MVFGSFTKGLRVSRGMSVRDLAARLGVDPALLSRVESGRAHPSEALVQRLAAVLGRSSDELSALAVPHAAHRHGPPARASSSPPTSGRRRAPEPPVAPQADLPFRQGAPASVDKARTRSRRRVEGGSSASASAAGFGPFELDTIQAMDCVEGMARLPDACVDLAIADPPYNASKGGEWRWDNAVALPGFGGRWQKVSESWDSMELPEYVAFTRAWLGELRRVVKPTGSLWIHGTYHNIGIINFLLQTLSVEIINEVIWYKRNSFPNLAGRRLTASHESILWAHTGRKREYAFDYAASKSMECPEDGLRTTGKQMRTVWDIPNNKDRDELEHGKHPTQKPLRLLTRMIRLSAAPGAVCLVPFSGSGSECLAAKRLGLRYLGFEVDPAYVDLARRRLAAPMPGPQAALPGLAPVEPPAEPRKAPARAPQPPRAPTTAGEAVAIPSLIKWTGSKRSQAKRIFELFPPYQRYFEPFLGGGALLYLAGRSGSVVGDVYGPLVDLWRLVQSDPARLVKNYRAQWQKLRDRFPEYFYDVRARFNAKPNPLDLSFLMRTCVNGIVRFNDKGEFNNSFHLSRPGMDPDRFAAIVASWSRRLESIEIRRADYAATVADAGAGDVVYLDPPYAGSTNRYVEDLDVDRLFAVLGELSARGVKWLLSFDGSRGDTSLVHPVPTRLYKRHLMIGSGHSPVGKVLNGPVEAVRESLYLNY